MYCNLSKTQVLPTAIRVSTHIEHLRLNPHNMSNIQSFSNGVYPKPLLNPKNIHFDVPRRVLLNKSRNIRFSFGGLCPELGFPMSRLEGFRSFSRVYGNGGDLPWLDDSGQVEVSKTPKKFGKGKIVGGSGGGGSKSSWEISAEKFVKNRGSSVVVKDEGRQNRVEVWQKPRIRQDERNEVIGEDWRKSHVRSDERNEDVGEGEGEVVSDPRWDKIKSRAGRVLDSRVSYERPEMRKWSREENWGRKTYREASESTVPKMVGEGLYGVGPVLAALSAGRREFYALYVQEGLELSKNNRKRRDKKGFEKVLKIAESLGLTLREISKHDLNMISDNRPHQGLVLDTSPLEMINIKELETASSEHDKGVLWVALDEVTDPQNLGAIIRSSYFFGAAGVVLCAKNSAPLSGVVSKASAGSLELMEMRSCKNMMQFLTSSADNGWRVVGGSVSSRAVAVREVAPGEPTILVLGSEGTGLRPLVERSCSYLVKIPGNIPVDVTSGRYEDEAVEEKEEEGSTVVEFRSFMAVESLNVSVAAGVLLHHFIGNNYENVNQQGNVVDQNE